MSKLLVVFIYYRTWACLIVDQQRAKVGGKNKRSTVCHVKLMAVPGTVPGTEYIFVPWSF